MNLLITGATGFVGTSLARKLLADGHSVRAAVRRVDGLFCDEKLNIIYVGDLNPDIIFDDALYGVDAVIHLAARTHIMNDKSSDPVAEYQRVNVEASLNLARQASNAGVKRFIYLSSIKVNGEFTVPGRPFTAEDLPMPQDPYGMSKYQAELGLRAIALKTGMEVVIIRPPLVYGPGVKANFLSMIRCLSRSIPLPLGAINNLRSLVALDNLVDLIVRCIHHPRAANQIFLVSDGEDVSIKVLLQLMGNALGRPARLISIPVSWLYFFASLLGRRPMVERLCTSLQVDISKTRKLLEWSPVIGLDEGLQRVVQDFKIQ